MVSTTLLIGFSCAVGIGIALFVLNYWNLSNICPEDNVSSAEMENYIAAVEHRLLWAEFQLSKSTASAERMVQYLQSRTIQLEKGELDTLYKNAQDEAIRIALQLSAQPAPTYTGVPFDRQSSTELERFVYDDIAIRDNTRTIDDKFGYGTEYSEYARQNGAWSENRTGEKGWIDDFVGFREDQASITNEFILSDSEAIVICNEWKGNYSVVPGVSWGNLPYDLQQKWLHNSCDYHLTDTGNAIITPEDDKEKITKGANPR